MKAKLNQEYDDDFVLWGQFDDEDDDGEDMTQEERENITNAKLLDRLYKAANIEHQAVVRFEGAKDDQENVIDN